MTDNWWKINYFLRKWEYYPKQNILIHIAYVLGAQPSEQPNVHIQ